MGEKLLTMKLLNLVIIFILRSLIQNEVIIGDSKLNVL